MGDDEWITDDEFAPDAEDTMATGRYLYEGLDEGTEYEFRVVPFLTINGDIFIGVAPTLVKKTTGKDNR